MSVIHSVDGIALPRLVQARLAEHLGVLPAVKSAIDRPRRPGQFLLTGCSLRRTTTWLNAKRSTSVGLRLKPRLTQG